MNKNLTIAAILSILLAILVPLYIAWQAQNAINTARIVKIKIDGYDPRDLLYGHYLMFRYDWNWKGGKAQPDDATTQIIYDKDSCLCVGPGNVDPEVELMPSCPAPGEESSCKDIIRGRYYGGDDFDPGQNQYFVGETVALPLEKMLRGTQPTWGPNGEIPGKPLPADQIFRLGIGVRPDGGKPVVQKMYVGEQTLDEYITDHYDVLTAPDPALEPLDTPSR